jgi:peptidoglycan/xylan/chitin deacetylase (PgdA/CDA1 family)
MYNRVADLPEGWSPLAVSPENFTAHLDVLRSNYYPMPLAELEDALNKRQAPERAVAVTFDDGYLDNLEYARPALESAGIPATIYVVAGQIGSRDRFWWDQLKAVFLLPEDFPPSLFVKVGGKEHVFPMRTTAQRREALNSLAQLLKRLPLPEIQDILDQLSAEIGLFVREDSRDRAMNETELVDISSSPLIEIGAHTLTHPVLSALPREAQQAEIVGSQKKLEGILDRHVETISYPYGEFNEETVQVVQSAGMRSALITMTGRVEPGDPLYRLRRCRVKDWDGDSFAENLEMMFHSPVKA